MKKLVVILFVIIFMLTSCVENGNKVGSGGGTESINGTDQQIICDESLQVLPIEQPIVMKFLKHFSFGQRAYAVYPARVDPVKALEDYTYGHDGVSIWYAQNTHDYVSSVKYNEIEYFDTITEMAKKGIIITPQILTVKFRLTLTLYSENSNPLTVYVRAKGSSDEWKTITLGVEGQTDYVYVETDENGELEYYLVESSYYDWKDDELGEPWYHCYGLVEGKLEADEVYIPFK